MAVPARCRNPHGNKAIWPVLRLVRGGAPVRKRERNRARRVSSTRQTAHCRRAFQFGCVVLTVACVIAMARVALVVQATEASLEAGMLKLNIEAETIRGERLEAHCSELEMPSRIRSIAAVSMGMDSATEVSYLTILTSPEDEGADGEGAQGPEMSESSDRMAGLLASVMRMTAGEAQVLLVGDAGLASSR